MMSIRIVRNDIPFLQREVGRMPTIMQKTAYNIGLKVTQYAVRKAREWAPHKTGMLSDSIKMTKEPIVNTRQIKSWGIYYDGPGAEYADAQEKGFKEHIIPWDYLWMRPKGTFVDYPMGFIKVSKTPKQGGYFLGPAIKAARTQFRTIAERELAVPRRN
jgi:hypothetical protein